MDDSVTPAVIAGLFAYFILGSCDSRQSEANHDKEIKALKEEVQNLKQQPKSHPPTRHP